MEVQAPSPRRTPQRSLMFNLDIKATTYERKGKFPLLHDNISSICISNGA